MNELLNMLLTLFRNQNHSYLEVYSAFDAVPVVNKSKKLFLVISPEKFELERAFSDGENEIAPFTANFRFSLLAPPTTPNDKLLEYFYSVLIPTVQTANCFLYEMQAEPPKFDVKLQKLTYAGIFRLKGIYLPSQEEQP